MYGIIRIQEDLANCEEAIKCIDEGNEEEDCIPFIIASVKADLSDVQSRIRAYMAEYEARITKLDEKKRVFCRTIRRNRLLDTVFMLKGFESDVRKIRRQIQKYQEK